MGAFYGGIANTPLAALVLVCEMAGSYELLVPLMLAEGVAFIALRRVLLYPAQVRSLRDSPVHRRESDPLAALRCADVAQADRPFARITADMRIADVAKVIEGAPDQDVFPVVDGAGVLRGLISAESLRVVASNPEIHQLGVAADMMMPPVSVGGDADLRAAAQLMVANDLRSIPVTDASGSILSMLDEHDVATVILGTAPVAPATP
jgi:CIC family chloride channel protein